MITDGHFTEEQWKAMGEYEQARRQVAYEEWWAGLDDDSVIKKMFPGPVLVATGTT